MLLLIAAMSAGSLDDGGHDALAQPKCPEPIDAVVSVMEMQGATFEGLVDVKVDGFDQVLIFTQWGHEVVGLALRGCVIGGPVSLKPQLLGDKHG